jgi:hypothetical protein
LLIGVNAVGKRKDWRQGLVRLGASSVLGLNTVPGVFIMVVGGAFIGPIDGLVEVPKPRGVDIMVLSPGVIGQTAEQNGSAKEMGPVTKIHRCNSMQFVKAEPSLITENEKT